MTMNRRDILKRLLPGAAALSIAAPVLAKTNTNTGGMLTIDGNAPSRLLDAFMFHGWDIRWCGWKQLLNQDARVTQWVAYDPDRDTPSGHRYGWQLYSSWPGETGAFMLGGIFNIAQQPDQIMPTPFSSDMELDWIRNECLERLKRFIIKVGPPPYDPYKDQR